MIKRNENQVYDNLKIEENKLYITYKGEMLDEGVWQIGNIIYGDCSAFSDEIEKNSENLIIKYNEEGIEKLYEIKYVNNNLQYDFVKNNITLEEYKKDRKICIKEVNNQSN